MITLELSVSSLVPSEPLQVMVSPENMTGILVVSWAPPTYPNAPTLNYTVSYVASSLASGERAEVTTGADEVGVVIPGLLPFTNYSVTVQACSEVGCGLESEEIIKQTLEEG